MKLKLLSFLIIALSLASCKCMKKGGCAGELGKEYSECVKRKQEKGMLTDGEGRILILDRTFFAFNTYTLTPEAKKTLDGQAAWLQSNPETQILITGHCDERGTREYNVGLGERRANAARDYLVSAGVDAGRIQVISKGKDEPIVLGSTEAAWAQNRVAITSQN